MKMQVLTKKGRDGGGKRVIVTKMIFVKKGADFGLDNGLSLGYILRRSLS